MSEIVRASPVDSYRTRIQFIANQLQAINHCRKILDDNSEFQKHPLYVGHFSSGSRRKQYLAAQAVPTGLMPIQSMPGLTSLFAPPELNPYTGEVEDMDQFSASLFRLALPKPEEFLKMSLDQQVVYQALLKAVCDLWVSRDSPFIWSTDIRGQAGDGFPLTKLDRPEEQYEALTHISRSGTINGVVAVVFGKVADQSFEDEIGADRMALIRLINADRSFKQGVRSIRVTVDMTDEEIRQYMDIASETEIAGSGFVLDVTGKHGVKYVKKIEVADVTSDAEPQYAEVHLNDILSSIIGYPADLILKTAQAFMAAHPQLPGPDKNHIKKAMRYLEENRLYEELLFKRELRH